MSYTTNYLTKYKTWVKPMLTDVIKYAEGLGKTYNASVYKEIIEGVEKGLKSAELYRMAEMVEKMGEYYFKMIKYKYIEDMTHAGVSKEMGVPFEYIERDIPKIYECFTRDATLNYVTHGQEFLDSFKQACESIRRYNYHVDLNIHDFNVSVRFADEVSQFNQGIIYYILNCIAACDLTPLKTAGISDKTIHKLFAILEEYKLVPYWVGNMPADKLTIPVRPPYNIIFAIGEFNGSKVMTPDMETVSLMVMQGMTRNRILHALVNTLTYKENMVVREKYFNRKSHKEIAAAMGLSTADIDKMSADILKKLRTRDAQRLMIETMDNLQNESSLTSILSEKKSLVEKGYGVKYSDKEKSYLNYLAWLQENNIYGRTPEI